MPSRSVPFAGEAPHWPECRAGAFEGCLPTGPYHLEATWLAGREARE
jgi:hypothetical protein